MRARFFAALAVTGPPGSRQEELLRPVDPGLFPGRFTAMHRWHYNLWSVSAFVPW